LLYGRHVLETLLRVAPESILQVFISKQSQKNAGFIARLQSAGISVENLNPKVLDKWLPEVNHQGIAMKIKMKQPLSESFLIEQIDNHRQPLFLVLDGIQDPQNLGACLRVAEAAKVQAVILP